MSEQQDNQVILRQITDHIVQCLSRIEDNIEHIVFIRKNSNIRNISQRFYIQQIDRFSRDTIITFNHILNKNKGESTLFSLILKIKDQQKRKKMEARFEKLRQYGQVIVSHRNKVIAHHETDYNSQLEDYYPAQLFNYVYPLNPCFCNRFRLKTAKLFWDAKRILGIDGVGMFHYGGGNLEDVLKTEALGAKNIEDDGLGIFHKCRYKECLLR